MGSHKKKKVQADDAATAKLPLDTKDTLDELVADCNAQISLIEENSDLANQPDLQAKVNTLKASVGVLSGHLSDRETARNTVTTLGTVAASQAATVRRDHKNVGAAVNSVSQGKKATILAWGGKVVEKVSLPATTNSPVDVRATSDNGTVKMRCKSDPQAKGYWFQMGADAAHPETWAAPAFENGVTHIVPGQTVGAKLSFRVAVQRRKTGLGQWSDVVTITVK